MPAASRLELTRPSALPGTLAALFTLPLLLACSPLSPAPAAGVAPMPVGTDAPDRCHAMAQVQADQLRITTAEWVPAGQVRARDPQAGAEVGDPLPAHCLLRGRLDERIGVDREPYHTGFELRLPAAGNGRLLYQGGGGNDGVLHMAVGRNTGALGWADNGLQRGFAAVSTDAGHQSPAPTFGLDPKAREEHAWRAHWRTATTARLLFERWYGRTPQRSYFIGCSGGGRQGMMFTQRFPELFDGVIAQAPAMRVSQGATIAAAWTVQKFLQVAPAGPDGRPVLSAALGPAQLQRVAADILERCDAADGLADGLVSDTALCRVNLARLTCPAGGEGCLSRAQAAALQAVMAGPVNRDGGRLYFPWPWDPGIAHPGWRAWTLGTSPTGEANARHVTLISGALGFEFVTPPDPTLTVTNFDFERDPLRMQSFHRVYGTADDVMLKPFQQRGGKLMLIHGMADPIFSAFETIDYQQRVNAAHGEAAASRFVRTFLVPGMNHCAGGPATDAFDGLSALQGWVEDGRAPERLPARGTTVLPGIERPLCPYPRIARYTGGDTARADSFECR
jgi:Tannase and feruloyl esterase